MRAIVDKGEHDAMVVNSRDQKIYDSFTDLLRGAPPYNTPIYSFNGKNVFRDPTW